MKRISIRAMDAKTKQAKTLQAAWNALDPETPLSPGDSRYVALGDVRGGEHVIAHMLWQIEASEADGRFTNLLVTGHRGNGKSTELLRLTREVNGS